MTEVELEIDGVVVVVVVVVVGTALAFRGSVEVPYRTSDQLFNFARLPTIKLSLSTEQKTSKFYIQNM